MAALLRIDASPLGIERSFSRQLTQEFVDHWRSANPEGQVITRDLAHTTLPPVSAEWIDAVYSPQNGGSTRLNEALAVSDQLIAELQHADEYVFGVPMYNSFIPGVLKLWIDQVVRVGKTYAYENGGFKGLLSGKKATIVISSGGVYEPGTPSGEKNFVEPYLRGILNQLGVSDVQVVRAGGTGRARHGIDRATILETPLASIERLFTTAA